MSLNHVTKTVTITAPSGFHARPASQFVNIAKDFDGEITLTFGERKANGKSVMNLLTLGAKSGSEIKIEVKGQNAEPMAQSLVDFLKTMS